MASTRSGKTVDTTTSGMEDLKKALFKSPNSEDDTTEDMSKELMSKLQIEHDIDASVRGALRDLHDGRMKQLRDLQTDITADDWQYTPIEKLIGLH